MFLHNIINTPKGNGEYDIVKSLLCNLVPVDKLLVNVNRVGRVGYNNVLLDCMTHWYAETLKNELAKFSFAEAYDTVKSKKRHPQFVIKVIENEIDPEELYTGFIVKHDFLNRDNFKVDFSYGTKSRYSWVISVLPDM